MMPCTTRVQFELLPSLGVLRARISVHHGMSTCFVLASWMLRASSDRIFRVTGQFRNLAVTSFYLATLSLCFLFLLWSLEI